MQAPEPEADPASFRDPSNRVLIDDRRVLRGLDATAKADFDALAATDFYRREQLSGRLIATQLLAEAPAGVRDRGWLHALEHTRVPVVTYPYEWSFSMLRDAALLELDLTLAALAEGMITKDATPYNVQFVGPKPVHIDIGSFERLERGDPWFGYRQFCEQFLYPLILSDRRGLTHHRALRGSVRGITPADCAAALRWRDFLRPGVLIHVGLNARADRRRKLDDTLTIRSELKTAGLGAGIIEAQVRRLRQLVARLDWQPSSSLWADYSDRSHYEDDALRAKAEFVEAVAARRRRSQVVDLGANDGYFSRLVASDADLVVAIDHDPLVVDRLYREVRRESEARILPLVVDLADPAGGIGWRSRERAPLGQRLRPELVLCLALIHHLAITESIPLAEVVAFLADWQAEVVVEFPRLDDEMVQVLLAQKRDRAVTAERYDIDDFEAALTEHFRMVERVETGTRVLYHLEPVSNASRAGTSASSSIEAEGRP